MIIVYFPMESITSVIAGLRVLRRQAGDSCVDSDGNCLSPVEKMCESRHTIKKRTICVHCQQTISQDSFSKTNDLLMKVKTERFKFTALRCDAHANNNNVVEQ